MCGKEDTGQPLAWFFVEPIARGEGFPSLYARATEGGVANLVVVVRELLRGESFGAEPLERGGFTDRRSPGCDCCCSSGGCAGKGICIAARSRIASVRYPVYHAGWPAWPASGAFIPTPSGAGGHPESHSNVPLFPAKAASAVPSEDPPGFSRGEESRDSVLASRKNIATIDDMKLFVQTQLLPHSDQDRKLWAIAGQFHAAANFAVGVAIERRTASVYDVRKLAYAEIRERFGLSSRMAQLAIKAACDAYRRDKSIRPVIRPDAAIVSDQRVMSFKGINRVNPLTLEGRVVVPFVLGKSGDERFKLPKGQSDLILREDGKWILLVTVDVPEGPRSRSPTPSAWISGSPPSPPTRTARSTPARTSKTPGASTTSNAGNSSARGPRGQRKELRRVSTKEARFRRHQDHVISKTLVETAKRTGRGIALEDLQGIRDRVTARGGDARNRLSGWAFGQLDAFLASKARLAGIPVETVDPGNTSCTCAQCGHCRASNRRSQAEFVCKGCGHRAHADANAARNLRARALAQRAQELVA